MYNKVTLIGRVGKDAETRKTETATVTSFSLATSESYKDKDGNWQEQTQWHNIVAWRELAERRSDLKKGERIMVEGKVTYRQWEKDGVKHYATDIIADSIRRLDKKQGEESAQAQKTTEYSAPTDSNDLPF